jgi:hypothetical protein
MVPRNSAAFVRGLSRSNPRRGRVRPDGGVLENERRCTAGKQTVAKV